MKTSCSISPLFAQIADVPGILHNIEESPELRATWDKYRKQFAYAAAIEYEQIIEISKTITLRNYIVICSWGNVT